MDAVATALVPAKEDVLGKTGRRLEPGNPTTDEVRKTGTEEAVKVAGHEKLEDNSQGVQINHTRPTDPPPPHASCLGPIGKIKPSRVVDD